MLCMQKTTKSTTGISGKRLRQGPVSELTHKYQVLTIQESLTGNMLAQVPIFGQAPNNMHSTWTLKKKNPAGNSFIQESLIGPALHISICTHVHTHTHHLAPHTQY